MNWIVCLCSPQLVHFIYQLRNWYLFTLVLFEIIYNYKYFFTISCWACFCCFPLLECLVKMSLGLSYVFKRYHYRFGGISAAWSSLMHISLPLTSSAHSSLLQMSLQTCSILFCKSLVPTEKKSFPFKLLLCDSFSQINNDLYNWNVIMSVDSEHQ